MHFFHFEKKASLVGFFSPQRSILVLESTIAITIVAYAHALVQWPFLLQVDLI